jgi:hypothetical protein
MSETSTRQSNLVAEAIGKRFCIDHQREVPEDNGSFVTSNKRTRWICFNCQKNREAFQKHK